MALPKTREELKEYCLRKLGHPVIEINVSNDQLEDCIDEALEYFQQYHFDGVESIFLKHKVSSSTLKVELPFINTFRENEKIKGQTSNSECYFIDYNNGVLRVEGIVDDFIAGEQIKGEESNTLVNLVSTTDYQIKGDYDNKYIVMPENVLSVIQVYNSVEDGSSTNLTNTSSSGSDASLFNMNYQAYYNSMPDLLNLDLVSYTMYGSHLANVKESLYGKHPIRHNKKTNKLYIDFSWRTFASIDKYIVIECNVAIDENLYSEVWSDYFLREYTKTLIKKQWGTNLAKFEGIQLPGGVTLNSARLLQEANEELEKLEVRIRKEFELPVTGFIG